PGSRREAPQSGGKPSRITRLHAPCGLQLRNQRRKRSANRLPECNNVTKCRRRLHALALMIATVLVFGRRSRSFARLAINNPPGRNSMQRIISLTLLASAALFALDVGAQAQQGPQPNANMSFFVTSKGPGKGADLGGIAGADAHCQQLAQSVG